MRVGIGFDLHRLVPSPNGSIPLGGVSIPCDYRIEAHSDGDVLLHAIVDACLGAAALGDIGQWFPDHDPEHRGKDSRDFIRVTLSALQEKGFCVEQCDTNLLLERPKLKEYRSAIHRSIADLLGIGMDRVGIKAKTMEGLGEIGRGEAVAAQAIVVLGACAGTVNTVP